MEKYQITPDVSINWEPPGPYVRRDGQSGVSVNHVAFVPILKIEGRPDIQWMLVVEQKRYDGAFPWHATVHQKSDGWYYDSGRSGSRCTSLESAKAEAEAYVRNLGAE